MAYINVDMDEFSTSEIINELENRYLDNREKDFLIDIVKAEGYRVDECIKLKLFFAVYHKYSVLELEEMFKENYSTIKSENQLTLPI